MITAKSKAIVHAAVDYAHGAKGSGTATEPYRQDT